MRHLSLSRLLVLTVSVIVLAGCGGQRNAKSEPTAVAVVPTSAPTQAPTATPVPPTPTAAPTPTATAIPTPTVIVELPQDTPTVEGAMGTPAGLAELPVATDAVDLTYDEEAGDVNYTSSTDITTLVDFYRQELPKQGWQEDLTAPLVTDTIGSIDFTKGEASLNVTVLNIGDTTDVTIATSGLPTGIVTEITPEAGGTVTETLTAEDKDGLPVPSDYTETSSETSPYRQTLTAVSPSSLTAVLALYRNELAAREWEEIPGTVAPTDTQADLLFNNPDKGQLVLTLTQNESGGTDISAVIRVEAAAKAAGILPPTGKARIYFANITDGEVTFNINKKDVAVGVQAPTQNSMEGVPSVDLAPGKYDFTLTIAGGAPIKDSIELKADETWALAAGPGGSLALQMY